MAHGISAAVGKLGALSADIIMGVVSPPHALDPSLPATCLSMSMLMCYPLQPIQVIIRRKAEGIMHEGGV